MHASNFCKLFLLASFFNTTVHSKPASSDLCEPDATSEAIGDRSTCTFATAVDVDWDRIPRELTAVSCRCPDRRCSVRDGGDFRCQQVTQATSVAYRVRGSSSTLRNETIHVVSACVCATSWSVASPGGVGRPPALVSGAEDSQH
ncbi:uncharacterized protein LOC142557542 [Dermacentor variabilis]|uniref:uncharacterized protein LOC142557542 n=1 Tax=Dermacentor variabilis TaxID=34621 RepID=UPI003F5AF3F9